MRHRLTNVLVTAAVASVLSAGVGCARDPAPRNGSPGAGEPTTSTAPTTGTPANADPARSREAQVYAGVLRRYLSTPAENSFPGQRFKQVFVLDRALANSGRPMAGSSTGTAIPAQTQRLVIEASRDLGAVSFVADRAAVVVKRDNCEIVRDGGILITVGPLVGDDKRVEVGFQGFVACLGATWLTYVVERGAGTAWRVTGTTGPMAIA